MKDQEYYTLTTNFTFETKDHQLTYDHFPVSGISIYYQTLITNGKKLLVFHHQSNHEMKWEDEEMGFLDEKHTFHPFNNGEEFNKQLSDLYMQSYDLYDAKYLRKTGYQLICNDDELNLYIRKMIETLGCSINMQFVPAKASIDLLTQVMQPVNELEAIPVEEPHSYPLEKAVKFLQNHSAEFDNSDNLPVINAQTGINAVWG